MIHLTELPPRTKVSMNFFCFAPSYIEMCEEEFSKFLDVNLRNIKAEFLIPTMADYFIKSGRGIIEIVPTNAKWFGVTYKEELRLFRQILMPLWAGANILIICGQAENDLLPPFSYLRFHFVTGISTTILAFVVSLTCAPDYLCGSVFRV